jgi:hypothetical protein
MMMNRIVLGINYVIRFCTNKFCDDHKVRNQVMSKKSIIKSIMKKPFSKLDRLLFENIHENIRYVVENEIIYSVDDIMIFSDLVEHHLRGEDHLRGKNS